MLTSWTSDVRCLAASDVYPYSEAVHANTSLSEDGQQAEMNSSLLTSCLRAQTFFSLVPYLSATSQILIDQLCLIKIQERP